MERFLSLVEEPSQQDEVQTDEEKLKQFLRKVKLWDYARISLSDYQKLSVNDRCSILKNYYFDMLKKYSGSGNFFGLSLSGCFFWLLFLFTHFFCCRFVFSFSDNNGN